jgi:type I restriction enzyme S subunit
MSDQSDLEQFASADSGSERQPAEHESEAPDPEEHGTARFPSLPTDWEIKRLDEVATVQGGSTPSTDEDEYWGGDILWATPTDLTELQGNTISDTEDTITKDGLKSSSTHVLPPYSVLLTSRASIGKCAVNTVPMATNQGFQSLIPGEEVNTWYLYYVITEMAPYLESLGAGSTFSEISKREVQRVQIPVPPMEEQLRIASALRNISLISEKTEQEINQLERLLRGVMQQLYTEGVSDHQATKETPFGTVPDSWKVGHVGDHIKLVSGAHVKSDNVSDDQSLTPYITGPEDFTRMGIEVSKYTDQPTNFCEPGDILVTVKGSGCGKVSLANERVCISRQLKALRPKDIDRDFLYYYLKYRGDQLRTLAEGSAIPGLTNSHITTFGVPLPPKKEQKQIGETLRSIDEQISHIESYHQELKKVKEGVREDLISGEVRVQNGEISIIERVQIDG